MQSSRTTLVCFAVKEEATAFRRLILSRPDIRLLITGMGTRNAAQSVERALAGDPPTCVVSAGFAGGLNPEFARGTVVFSENGSTGLAPALLRAGARRGRFYFAEQIVTRAEQKRTLHESSAADAVEMESRTICEICAKRNIPCTTVRVILDSANEDLPLDFNQVLTPELRIDGLKLAGLLLKSPQKIGALLKLRQQSEFAARALAQTLMAALQDNRPPLKIQ